MKKVFSVLAVAAMVLVSFSGCTSDKTYTDLLTQSKGWVLSAATSSPAYEMSDGSYVTDLINDGYLYDYEVDDVILFNANGGEIVQPGTLVPGEGETGYSAETAVGSWSFDNETLPTILNMQVPFFYDDEVEVCKLLSLTESELRISCTINDDDVAKGTYSFILTYVPAK